MRVHTNGFKTEITKFGREIDSRLYHYLHYGLATESNDLLLTEDSLELITEQTDEATKELIDNELIYSIDIVKNGQLFQSLMKECDFEAEIEFRVGDMINPQLGVLVNGAYEYLDYGNYIIYSKEYIAENKTWRYVCYDKMLYSMIQYKPLDLTYPCTIRDYLIALASRIGLPFANSSDSFTNYNAQVLDELFEGQSITYRDILDKLSEITASNILINDNDELEIKYVNKAIGENLCGLDNQSFSVNGVDIKIENGSITLNGTATAEIGPIYIQPVQELILNGDYSLNLIYVSGSTSGEENKNFNVRNANTKDYIIRVSYINENNYDTFNFDNQKVIFGLYANVGSIFNNYTVKPQLVKGAEADYDYKEFETFSVDTIDEENLKDVNVNFGEVFGPINKVSIQETDGGYEYASQDDSSINQNGLTQINIVDNIFAFNGNSETIAQNILNKIKGLTYSICDFTTTGVCYYDFLDLFNVSADNTNYKCLLLNNEINISQGISEQIFNQKLKNSEKESDNFKTSVMNSKEVSFQINKQKGEIQSKVEKDGVISAINQSAEEIQINANKIKLEGYTTINDGFSVDLEGNMIAKGGTFTGGNVTLNDNGEYSNAELIVNNTSQDTSARIYSKGFHVIDKSKSNNNNQITLGYSYETNGNRNYPLLRFTNVYNNNLDNNDYCTISAYSIQLYNANGNHTTITQNGITTPTLTQTSKAELKKNFEKLENALDIINKTDIYKYNLKNEEDTCKKHIGLVIGDNYKYSKEITSNKNDSVDLYSMISVCFKAIQEQQKQIETLQTKIEKLEKEVK